MTKEEFDALDRYQQKHIKLLSVMKEDDDLKQYKVISFFKPLGRGQQPLSGKIKQVPITNYTKVVDSSWAVKHLTNKLYTKGGKLRKKYVDMPDWMQYDVGALMLYLNQCYKERCGKALLSYKEYKFLLESDMKCAVKNCSNHLHQGSFTGKFCSPCYSFITDKNTKGTRFAPEVLKDLTKNKEKYKEKL